MTIKKPKLYEINIEFNKLIESLVKVRRSKVSTFYTSETLRSERQWNLSKIKRRKSQKIKMNSNRDKYLTHPALFESFSNKNIMKANSH